MREILVVSGKGGTGKTSLTACFAQLSKNAVFCDCDVDAANLHLLLTPEVLEAHPFYAGWIPEADADKCTSCGICQNVCRFNALTLHDGRPELLNGLCEGCGVCAVHCPAGAIELKPRRCGRWYSSKTAHGKMFHAELFPGEENSGKLIAELRKAARMEAEKLQADLLISDGPPGIGCPVISSASGVDEAVIVTEPSASGIHDMKRLMTMLRQFEIPFSVIINKGDINTEKCDELKSFLQDNKIFLAGIVPFDRSFSEAVVEMKTVLEYPGTKVSKIIKRIWNNIIERKQDEY